MFFRECMGECWKRMVKDKIIMNKTNPRILFLCLYCCQESPNLLSYAIAKLRKKLITQFPEIDSIIQLFHHENSWKKIFKRNGALSLNQVINLLRSKNRTKITDRTSCNMYFHIQKIIFQSYS